MADEPANHDRNLPITERVASDLLAVASAYCDFADMKLGSLSQKIIQDRNFLPRLAEGGRTFALSSAERMMIWLSAHWPEDKPWVDGVKRPRISKPRGQADGAIKEGNRQAGKDEAEPS